MQPKVFVSPTGLALGKSVYSTQVNNCLGHCARLHRYLTLKRRMLTLSSRSDSFSAGPGAGDPIVLENEPRSCQRNTGGYPNQLQRGDLFQGGHENPEFTFLSCTGDKVPEVRDCVVSFQLFGD